ncbi:sugar phosphate isomerase/epimerase [Algoriphagus kandeliae]|uniref:Sugar phosphate isomerase/epimerase n=1 Tax=Algoriphagus kandeliae TaxID=2562278 RepID=A0A4Y9QLU6_9BACT|nr:sugar phosphate isomerase/epimerase [Algoriphagus kandeliae]TFV93220.1 sugar phosphate isomerase/epimerase [Algoriphagus kandeliae]
MRPKNLILSLFLFLLMQVTFAQEIAIQTYSLRNQLPEDPVKYYEMIADWGIHAIEGGGLYGLSEVEYERLFTENRLRIVGVGADYNQLLRDPAPIIEEAKKQGVKYATCYWIPHQEGPISLDEIKVATALFNEVGKDFQKEGITLLYHPHGYEFSPEGKGVVMDWMLENAENFAFNMDVYWVKMGGGDPLKIMKKHKGKFPMLHLKDRKIGTPNSNDGHGDVETNVVLGTGDVGIEKIIKEAQKQGTTYLVIEDESSRSVEQIPLSVAFIKKVMGQD